MDSTAFKTFNHIGHIISAYKFPLENGAVVRFDRTNGGLVDFNVYLTLIVRGFTALTSSPLCVQIFSYLLRAALICRYIRYVNFHYRCTQTSVLRWYEWL